MKLMLGLPAVPVGEAAGRARAATSRTAANAAPATNVVVASAAPSVASRPACPCHGGQPAGEDDAGAGDGDGVDAVVGARGRRGAAAGCARPEPRQQQEHDEEGGAESGRESTGEVCGPVRQEGDRQRHGDPQLRGSEERGHEPPEAHREEVLAVEAARSRAGEQVIQPRAQQQRRRGNREGREGEVGHQSGAAHVTSSSVTSVVASSAARPSPSSIRVVAVVSPTRTRTGAPGRAWSR